MICAAIRQDFPILGTEFRTEKGVFPLVYLDNAATSQKPSCVIDRISRYYREENANVHRSVHRLGEIATERFESARRKAAQFIGASSEQEIVFTRGTTEAINLVASSWGKKFLQPGQAILLPEMEHHSNLVPWQVLAKEKGLRLRFIPFFQDGTLDLSELDSWLGEGTGLLAMAHASNVFGTVHPVREIIRMAQAHGVPVLLDAAQSVPSFPVDVGSLECDFLAFSGHKMCGPTGIGVLYAKGKWLQEMAPYQCGGEMIESVWLDHSTYQGVPHRFEAGTPDVAGAVGMAAAIEYLSALGMENVLRHEREMLAYASSRIREETGALLFGPPAEGTGILSLHFPGIHPHDMAQFLDEYGIAVRAGHHCAQPLMRKLGVPGTVRISFYFYNTFQEVDCLVQTLQKAEKFFSHGTR